MPLSRTRKIAYSAATVLGLVGGSAAVAAATTDSANSATGNPSYTSSVHAPDTENEQNLAGLATATPDQAVQAAKTATGGTAQQAQLENENGNVVYSVGVTMPDGSQVDVKVDAGDAKVLAQEPGGQETADRETNDGTSDTQSGEKTGETQQETNDAPATGAASATNG